MDYLYEDTTVYIILFVVAFFASLIDSIAGGGGLLTTPSMLLVGIPPLNVLATNKFQSCFGTFTSTFNYYKNGLIEEKKREWPEESEKHNLCCLVFIKCNSFLNLLYESMLTCVATEKL